MKKIFVLVATCLIFPLLVKAEETWIQDVSPSGKVITTPEYVIIVTDYDTFDTQMWLPMTDVVITDDYIINVDDGEKAEIEKIMYK